MQRLSTDANSSTPLFRLLTQLWAAGWIRFHKCWSSPAGPQEASAQTPWSPNLFSSRLFPVTFFTGLSSIGYIYGTFCHAWKSSISVESKLYVGVTCILLCFDRLRKIYWMFILFNQLNASRSYVSVLCRCSVLCICNCLWRKKTNVCEAAS